MVTLTRGLLATALAAMTATAQAPVSVTFDLSYVSASGASNLRTASAGDQLSAYKGPWSFSQSALFVEGSANKAEDANELRLSGRAEHSIASRFSAFVLVAAERNTFAGFRARDDQSAGVEWKALGAPTDSLSLDGGGGYTEELDDNHTATRYGDGRAAAWYKHVFAGAASLQESAEYIPALRANAGHRVNSQTKVAAPLSKRIALEVNYEIRYESRPPTGFASTSRYMRTGLQLTF